MNIKYKINHFNFDKNKLTNQMKELVNTFEELSQFDEDCQEVNRDELYENWLIKIGKEENSKVFASYVHQLCQFSFIERIESDKKKVDKKEQLKRMLSKMTKEELEEILSK